MKSQNVLLPIALVVITAIVLFLFVTKVQKRRIDLPLLGDIQTALGLAEPQPPSDPDVVPDVVPDVIPEVKPPVTEEHPQPEPEVTPSIPVAYKGTSYDAAYQNAQARKGKMLVFFHAEWCGPCKTYARTRESDSVVTALQQYSEAVVDIDQHKELAQKFHVSSIPHTALIDFSTDPPKTIKAQVGAMDAQTLIEWLP